MGDLRSMLYTLTKQEESDFTGSRMNGNLSGEDCRSVIYYRKTSINIMKVPSWLI